MIIKVTGAAEMSLYNHLKDNQPQTHFYKPQTTKEEVKKDFGLVLDVEIKKLKFDILI